MRGEDGGGAGGWFLAEANVELRGERLSISRQDPQSFARR